MEKPIEEFDTMFPATTFAADRAGIAPTLLRQLPGPDRKRRPAVYSFVQRYRNRVPGQVGCIATWEVFGGRMPYQIALERDPARRLHWHCTCADAIYRGDQSGHPCKHIDGLVDFLAVTPAEAAAPVTAVAA